MSFGVLQPTIVLPLPECRSENIARLRHVLRHELAHLYRRDALGNLVFNFAFPLLYFHPCFWWVRSRVRTAAEVIADDLASRDVPREEYVRELIGFVRACRPQTLHPAEAIGILASMAH